METSKANVDGVQYDSVYRLAYKSGVEFVEPLDPTRLLTLFVSRHKFPPRAKVIEFACGEGRDSVFLARKGFRVLGTDGSKWAIGQARKRARREKADVDFEVRDLTRLSGIAVGTFDLAVNIDAMSFVTADSARRNHYHEAFRVLKNGGIYFFCSHFGKREAKGKDSGILVATTPSGDRVRIRVPRVSYVNRTRKSLEKELRSAGFRVLSSKVAKTHPIPAQMCVIIAQKPTAVTKRAF